MKIEIDIAKKALYVPKEIAQELREETKRKKVSVLRALERTQYLDEISIVTITGTKREITDEEHRINKLTVEEIKAEMKKKPEADQEEFKKFMEEEERKLNGELTKLGTPKKVNSMKIKSWYKNKYFKKSKKSTK